MAGCLRESQIERYVVGSLPAHELNALRDHLKTCAACRMRVEAAEASTFAHDTTSRIDLSVEASKDRGEFPSIDGYEILARLHGGAQGVVYKALQKSTNRTVAVKLLLQDIGGHAATQRQKHRFEREVSLAASLRHPNIVTVYDSGLTSGRYFFAMEYIHGQPLNEYLKTSPLTVPQKLRLFTTICSAVGYAHQKGVIHRDLKPGNIMIDALGQPHVVDFGLAKSAGMIAMHGEAPLTLTSQFMGTIAYASPEQTKGDPALVDMRSDIYSLGVILFEMLTGTYPYPVSTSLVKMFETICHTPPRSPSSIADDVDHDIDTIVLRALAKEPDRRYQTVGELQQDLDRWLSGEPISARRDSLAYLMRLKSRRFIQRRPVGTLAAIAVLAFVLAEFGASRFVYDISKPVNRLFVRMLLAAAPLPPFPDRLDHVVVIGLMPDTDVSKIAEVEGLADVTPEPIRSVRRLHGRLMEKLAAVKPAVVCWDIAFPEATFDEDDPDRDRKSKQATEFNQDFVAGIRALQSNGVEVILANDSWSDEAQMKPNIAQALLDARTRLGGITTGVDAPIWTVDLAVQRGSGDALKSIAIESFAAFKRPAYEVAARFDSATQMLHLAYKKPEPDYPHLYTRHPQEDALACDIEYAEANEYFGLLSKDILVRHTLRIPDQRVIESSTYSYQKIMSASAVDLANWIKGKIVLVGVMVPARNGGCACVDSPARVRIHTGDLHRTSDGWPMWGVQSHALAMDDLLSRPAITYARKSGQFIFTSAGAIAGIFVAVATFGRRKLRLVYAAAFIMLSLGVCIITFRGFNYLIAPHVPITAMAIAAILAALAIHRPYPTQMHSSIAPSS